MFSDILMAFVIALFVEWVHLTDKVFKQIMVIVFCISIIVIYFVSGCQLNYIGEINFGVWILFVILFDQILMIGINELIKHIKE